MGEHGRKGRWNSEIAKLRAALEEILTDTEKAKPGDTDTAYRAIGGIQAAACRALGISWSEWDKHRRERDAANAMFPAAQVSSATKATP